jgi:formylglycine-generating enzyme required for sulfatase activity
VALDDCDVASREESRQQTAPPNMIWIPGGTFRMGSDRHYPEDSPVHRVTVSGFWIDRTPVTNRQFKQFVRATGHKIFAEIRPNPKSYPGALPLSRRILLGTSGQRKSSEGDLSWLASDIGRGSFGRWRCRSRAV